MVPAGEGATFEVVQAEFPLEFLVGPFRAPAFLDDAHDLLLRHTSPKGREDELVGLRLAFGPFDHEPEWLTVARVRAVVLRDLDAAKCEPRGQLGARTLAPGEPAEGSRADACGELLRLKGRAIPAPERVQQPDLGVSLDGDAEVEAEDLHGVPEVDGVSERSIGEHDLARDLIFNGADDEIDRQVGLRLEHKVLRHPRLLSTSLVFGPRLGHVEREVDRHVLVPRRDREAHAGLTVSDLAERAAVLALHADRVLALLREAGVVHDPGRHGLLPLKCPDDVASSLPPHALVVPRALAQKVEQPRLHSLARRRIARRTSSDRLDALSLAVTEDPVGVHGERLPLRSPTKMLADRVREEPFKPALHACIDLERHGCAPCARSRSMETPEARAPYNREDTVRNKRHGPTSPAERDRVPPDQSLAVVLAVVRESRAPLSLA